MKTFGSLVAMLLLAACAHWTQPGPSFARIDPVPAGHAVIYIYRGPEWDWPLWPSDPEILVNGQRRFNLLPERYGVVTVPPGEHEIIVKGSLWTNWVYPDLSRRLEVAAGEEHYVRVSRDLIETPDGRTTAVSTLTFQPKSAGLADISKLRLFRD